MSTRTEAALIDVLEVTSPRLLGYLIRHLEHREDAADALAEVLLTAWRRRRTLPADPEQLNAWLFTTARNQINNQRRSSRRAARLAERLRLEFNPGTRVEPDPADRVAQVDEVARALAHLPDESAELVRLVHWDALSITAAAAVLELAPSTARSRYQAARAALRQHLDLALPAAAAPAIGQRPSTP